MKKLYEEYSVEDFLKDDSFLLWNLSPTESTHILWHTFWEQHPEKRPDMERARQILKTMRIKGTPLSAGEVNQIYHLTWKRYYRTRKKTARMKFYYAAACLAAIVLFSWAIYLFPPVSLTSHVTHTPATIETDSPDIQLIWNQTNKENFAEDANFTLTPAGEIQVTDKASRKRNTLKPATSHINQLYIPNGKRASLLLSDGTKIWINSGTFVSFPTTFREQDRTISTNGEIYIEVAPDKARPFYVKTSLFDIKVHGTQFNVMAYEADEVKSVVLVKGSVEIYDTHQKNLFLKPDEMLNITDGQWSVHTVDTYNYICWKDGVLKFSGENMSDILLRLSRHYGVRFDCDPQAARLVCTGKLVLFDNLDQVLRTLSDIFPIQYRMEQDQIKINVEPEK